MASAASPIVRNARSKSPGPQAVLVGLLLAVMAVAFPVSAMEPLQIDITGIEGEALANLRTALEPPAGLARDGVLDRQWFERHARQVSRLAGEALKPFGYYSPSIESRLEQHEPDRFHLMVEIQPGEPVRVAKLELSVAGAGADEKALRELREAFPLRRGDILRQDLYEEGKEELQAKAVDLGYLDAGFTTHRIDIDLVANRAEITLALATGARYRFGEVGISGAPDYPQAFLRRYLAFAPGDPFSHARLGQTQLNYFNSDRFREVTVVPRTEQAEQQQVPVDIQLVPTPRRRLRPGVGYGTDTGARATVNYRDVNLLHRGHELSAEIKAAEQQQSLSASYVLPSPRQLRDMIAFRAGIDHVDIDTYDSTQTFVEGEVVRSLGHGRLGSIYLRLLQENFTIGEEDTRSRLVLPGIQFSQILYDDLLHPRNGHSYRLELRGTDQWLGSDIGLLQALGSANAVKPLPWGLSLLARVQIATTWQNDPLREIPPSLRFFAGGDQSVRGYSYQSLGPRDGSGKVVGGKHLLVGSVELERPLTDAWGIALFVDAGNALDSFSDYEIYEGAGLGLRRYTPVGALKLDLARQLGVADPSYRLHIGIGFSW